ncbi:hypothetical protein [Microcoleus sp. B4-D4]|uniref:hypothetical protein n=1 Tax=Microcoleus sp. B4-D4 TaxID=2818667 RepID=UPI002FD18A5E
MVSFCRFNQKEEGRRKKEEGRRKICFPTLPLLANLARFQAVPGNADPEALPRRISNQRGRASRYRFPGRAREPVKTS